MTDQNGQSPKNLKFSAGGKQRALRAAQHLYGANTWQSRLSRQAKIHRQTVRRVLLDDEFIRWDNFDKICAALGLHMDEVSASESPQGVASNGSSSGRASGPIDSDDNLSSTVLKVRDCVGDRIQDACGTIQMMGSRLPIGRFVELNLYPILALPSEQMQFPRLAAVTALTAAGNTPPSSPNVDPEGFDRIGPLRPMEPPISCRSAALNHKRLLVYGWPGSGKTSYLKWLAIQCSRGEILASYVPVFLEMRSFAPKASQQSLYDEIQQYFRNCRVEDVEHTTERLLMEGRVFLLLDGLDEVSETQRPLVYTQIKDLLNNFYACRFAFSCRLPLQLPFGGAFDKMLIAPFNARQRSTYVRRWFETARAEKPEQITRQFLERLGKHVTYGELTRTPILLDLLCRVFRQYGRFPPTRADVYDLGLKSLLYEEAHNLRGGRGLRGISLETTRDLLRAIAAEFFLRPQIQIVFARRELEHKVRDYFVSTLDAEQANVSASRIISDVELTYGLLVQQASNLCSFSHLTFQEYFTAEYLVNTDQQQRVHQHLANTRWRFVIQLVAELLHFEQTEAFFEGFKRSVDALILGNAKILQFLDWLDQTAEVAALSVRATIPHTSTLLRAWYFAFTLEDRFTASATHRTQQFEFPDLDYATSTLRSDKLDLHTLLYRAWHATQLTPVEASEERYGYAPAEARFDHQQFVRTVDAIYTKVRHDPKQEVQFEGWRDVIRNQQRQHRLPQEWWDHNRVYWRQRVGRYIHNTHGLRCDWEFTPADVELLQTYYSATKLLSICLNLTRNVSEQQYHRLVSGMLRAQPVEESDS
ncbi:MAG: NACHT domain-containing protein [Elainellaceae cyanobacterium]